ncbi:hypothetical protein NQ315_014626 [Exocentrus adspersus]|uniref:Uncharacterized protein n=1 Tax=Exocentrus adspersus TaxID=1586481 RepID=A0AAV8VRB7_9CUCU|nr:hypothetical protein NQ315_014626 [Exocentrus adspersus]
MPLHYGDDVLNTLINKLPFELHIPGYQFCGPACRKHDIAYSQSNTLQDRHKADRELENRAWGRVKSRDAKFGEKASAWFITTTMKAKRNLGSCASIEGCQNAVKKVGGKKNIRIPRIIPFDTHHSGGFLPLIPLFAGLSALGSLAGGASAIAKTVIDTKKKLQQGHGLKNEMMKPIGVKGSGLYGCLYERYVTGFKDGAKGSILN